MAEAMTFRPLARLQERSYTVPAERRAFTVGYGNGYNVNEDEAPAEAKAWPNAYWAGYWQGVGDMGVKR